MSKKKILLQDANGNILYPRTTTEVIVKSDGTNANLGNAYTKDNLLSGKGITIEKAGSGPQYVEGELDEHTLALFHLDSDYVDERGYNLDEVTGEPVNDYWPFGDAAPTAVFGDGARFFSDNSIGMSKSGLHHDFRLDEDWTVDMWIKPYVFPADPDSGAPETEQLSVGMDLQDYQTWVQSPSFSTYREDGTLLSAFLGSTNITSTINDLNLDRTVYHHVAITRDASEELLTLFIDGHLVATAPYATDAGGEGATVRFQSPKGYFDEVRLSDIVRYTTDFTTLDHAYRGSVRVIESDNAFVKANIKAGANVSITEQDESGEVALVINAEDRSKTYVAGDNITLTEESTESGEVETVIAAPDAWTRTNLREGKNIEIVQKTNPNVIDEYTFMVMNFADCSPATISRYGQYIATATGGYGGTTTGLTRTGSGDATLGNSITLYTDNGSSTFTVGSQGVLHWGRTVSQWSGNPAFIGNAGCNGYATAGVITKDFWFKWGGDTWNQTIAVAFATTSGSSFEVRFARVSASAYRLYLYNVSQTLDKQVSSNLFDGEWHHVAVTFSAITKKLAMYMDGHYIETLTINVNFDNLAVMRNNDQGLAIYGGSSVDEYRISIADRYQEEDYEVPTEPYAVSASSDWYVINHNPDDAMSDTSKNSVQNKVVKAALDAKQDTISDLETIRSGAALGATAVQQADIADVWTKTNLKQGNHIAITQVEKPVIDGNTVALFHFDDSVDDEILTGPSATSGLSAQASAGTNYFGYVAGKFNNALQFGSTTTVNRIFDGFAYSQASTIDFWVKVLNTNGTYTFETYQASSGDAQDHTYKIWFNSGAISIYTRRGEKKLTKLCTLSDWNHVAVEIHSGNLNFYVNGIFVGSVVDAGLSSGYLYSEISSSQSGGISFDELRLSNIARYYPIYGEAGFTPNDESYAPADGPAEYTINSTLKAGQNIIIDAQGYISAVGGGSAPTVLKFKNFEENESDGEGHAVFPNYVDTSLDLASYDLVRVFKNGVYLMEDDESTESGAEENDYSIVGTKIMFKSALTANDKVIVEVL